MDLTTIGATLKTLKDLLAAADALIRSARGRRRRLLLEVRANIDVMRLFFEAATPIDKVIGKLDTTEIDAALQSNYGFNSVRGGRVKLQATGGSKLLESYVGKTTEDLFSTIYLKIKELRTIVEIDPQNEKHRKDVRLGNLLKLNLLLLQHVTA